MKVHPDTNSIEQLQAMIGRCELCKASFSHDPRPIVSFHPKTKIVIIGQAPGRIVHETQIPWNDVSGDNLRAWMGIEKNIFYDNKFVSIVPMGFCYPGKGRSGDLPPSKRCAPQWHSQILNYLNEVQLIILIGKYAQDYYLPDNKKNLTNTVSNYRDYLPRYFVLPHPSPRNNIWMKKNPWFAEEVLPVLKEVVSSALEQ